MADRSASRRRNLAISIGLGVLVVGSLFATRGSRRANPGGPRGTGVSFQLSAVSPPDGVVRAVEYRGRALLLVWLGRECPSSVDLNLLDAVHRRYGGAWFSVVGVVERDRLAVSDCADLDASAVTLALDPDGRTRRRWYSDVEVRGIGWVDADGSVVGVGPIPPLDVLYSAVDHAILRARRAAREATAGEKNPTDDIPTTENRTPR